MYANDKYINTILLSILSYIQHMDHQQFQSLQQTWGLESISTRLTSLNQPKKQISQQKTAIKTVQQKTLRFCVAAPARNPHLFHQFHHRPPAPCASRASGCCRAAPGGWASGAAAAPAAAAAAPPAATAPEELWRGAPNDAGLGEGNRCLWRLEKFVCETSKQQKTGPEIKKHLGFFRHLVWMSLKLFEWV